MTKTMIITLAILTNLVAMDPKLERPRATLYTKEGKPIIIDRSQRHYKDHPSFSNLVKNFAAKEIYKPKIKTMVLNNEISNESIEHIPYGIVKAPKLEEELNKETANSITWEQGLMKEPPMIVREIPIRNEGELFNPQKTYSIVREVPTKYDNEELIENVPYSIVRAIAVNKINELANEHIPYSIMRTLQESDKITYEKLTRISFENKDPDPEEFIIISSTKNPIDEKKTISRLRPRKMDPDETDSDG